MSATFLRSHCGGDRDRISLRAPTMTRALSGSAANRACILTPDHPPLGSLKPLPEAPSTGRSEVMLRPQIPVGGGRATVSWPCRRPIWPNSRRRMFAIAARPLVAVLDRFTRRRRSGRLSGTRTAYQRRTPVQGPPGAPPADPSRPLTPALGALQVSSESDPTRLDRDGQQDSCGRHEIQRERADPKPYGHRLPRGDRGRDPSVPQVERPESKYGIHHRGD